MAFPEKRKQFKALALAGVPYDTIRAALGVSQWTIFEWRRREEIPARKRGRKPKVVANGD